MNYQTEKYIRKLFYDAQNGICPICDKPLTGKISLDHDHATGEPRGLLHQACNMKVAQIETSTPYPRLTLTELALQFRNAGFRTQLGNYFINQYKKGTGFWHYFGVFCVWWYDHVPSLLSILIPLAKRVYPFKNKPEAKDTSGEHPIPKY